MSMLHKIIYTIVLYFIISLPLTAQDDWEPWATTYKKTEHKFPWEKKSSNLYIEATQKALDRPYEVENQFIGISDRRSDMPTEMGNIYPDDPQWIDYKYTYRRFRDCARFIRSYCKMEVPKDPELRAKALNTYRRKWNIGTANKEGQQAPNYDPEDLIMHSTMFPYFQTLSRGGVNIDYDKNYMDLGSRRIKKSSQVGLFIVAILGIVAIAFFLNLYIVNRRHAKWLK